MCDYCDCRSITEIADLSIEHERVLALTRSLRHGAGRRPADIDADLRDLRSALAPHTRREETGVFAVLAAIDCDPAYRRRFLDDHARIDEMIERALVDRAAVARLVELVERHIFEEETDLYPAIRQLFSPADWHEVEHRRERLVLGSGSDPVT